MIEHGALPRNGISTIRCTIGDGIQSRAITTVLRESGAMIVPMSVPKHDLL